MARGNNRLSATQVKNAAPGSVVQDGGGLSLKRSETGGRWTFRFQINGKRRDMGLGSYPNMSLSDARKERSKWAAFAERGEDPIVERERQRLEEEKSQNDPTFEEMAEMVFEGRKERLQGDGKRGMWYSPLKNHVIPKIGNRRISTLHQRDIHDALKPIWRTKHETADKAMYRTRMVLRQAKLMGYEAEPFICDAARHMLGYVERVQKPLPATPWQEIPDLYSRLDKEHPSYLALRFAILTAARGMPIRGARFHEIDGDVWTVPQERMKGERGKVQDFRIPLSTEAMNVVDICRELRRNDFLFPSPRTNKGVSDVAMAKVLNHLNEEGRIHGFRSSLRMWIQDNETASFEVAETALGHSIGNKVERSYARSDLLDKRRVLMQKWANFVTQAESKIVQLGG